MKLHFLIFLVCSVAARRFSLRPKFNRFPSKPPNKPNFGSKVKKIFQTSPTSKPVTNFAGKIVGNYAVRKTRGKSYTGRQRATLEQLMSPEMLTTLASMIIPFVIWELGQQKLNQDKNSGWSTNANHQKYREADGLGR